MQVWRFAWWLNVLVVRAVGLWSLMGKFGIPVVLAILWANSYAPWVKWSLSLGFSAWLVWSFFKAPAWLRFMALVVVLAAVIIGGGILLHGFWSPPTAEQTCPSDGLHIAKFNSAAISIVETFCQPAPLPPPLEVPLHSDWGQLPYINSRDFLQQLSRYACVLPSQTTLVVWGPKSTGKSKGIQVMAELWVKQGRLTIDIDLKDFVGGYDHFLHYFRTRTLQALSGHSLTADELRTCYVCSLHFRNKTRLYLEEQHHNVISRWLRDYGFNGSADAIANANAKWAKDLDSYLEFVFATTGTALGLDFQGLIEFLELLAIQRPQLAPVIILRELQYLNHINGEALISDILRTLESKKQGRSLVGVIIETSEYTWVESTNLLRSRESFQPNLVSYMHKEQSRMELVDVLKVISSEEFETMWEATQGHAGSIDMIFRYVRAGRSLEQSIKTTRTFTYEIMLSGLNKAGPDLLLKCEKELDRLRKNNWSLVKKQPLRDPGLHLLIEQNILYVFDGNSMVPQHEMMRWAIDTYLSQFPVPETD